MSLCHRITDMLTSQNFLGCVEHILFWFGSRLRHANVLIILIYKISNYRRKHKTYDHLFFFHWAAKLTANS